jgi:hypothetical protein
MAKMAQRPSLANQQILRLAEVERCRLGHPYLGDEHLLLGVLAHGSNPAAGMLNERGVDLSTARTDIARIVNASGPLAKDAAALLHEIGVDVAQMRQRLESMFGTQAVQEAERQVRRRPWWRGRAQHSPLCGPPHLIKRAQFIACTTAGKRGEVEIRPEHLLYAVLRVARDPLGSGLSRRGRREMARVGLRAGAPHPVRLLMTEHRIEIDRLSEDLLRRLGDDEMSRRKGDTLVSAAAAAGSNAEPPECWCCGSVLPESRLVRLGSHPEVGVCLRCAHFLHQQALGREDALHPSPASRVRDHLRSARRIVTERRWHQKQVIGKPLRWFGRRLP